MKSVNQAGQKVINYMAAKATENGGHIKIDNSGGCYMPVYVERIGENLLSIAHYYEQNGDLMADPEMVFFLGCDKNWYPVSIKMDGLGRDRTSVNIEDGKVISYHLKAQYDDAVFAGIWMRNIRNQQSLKVMINIKAHN